MVLISSSQEDEAEKKFKDAHPDFHDDEDLNEETPMLPKVFLR